MDDRYGRAGGDLCDAADIAGRDHVRLELFDVGDFAVAQLVPPAPAEECCRCQPSRNTDDLPVHL